MVGRDMPVTAITIITSNCIPEKPTYLKDCLMESMWVKTCHCSKNIHFISFLGGKKKNKQDSLIAQVAQNQKTLYFFLENVLILKIGRELLDCGKRILKIIKHSAV